MQNSFVKFLSILLFGFYLSGCVHYGSHPSAAPYAKPITSGYGAHLNFLAKTTGSKHEPKGLGEFSDEEAKAIIQKEIAASKLFTQVNTEFIDFRSDSKQLDIECLITNEPPEDNLVFWALLIPFPLISTSKLEWVITNYQGKKSIFSAAQKRYVFPFLPLLPAALVQRLWQDRDEIIYRSLSQDVLGQIRQEIEHKKFQLL